MRVHLSEWEWACCGDPFDVGDEVEFSVRPPSAWLGENYGPLGEGVDWEESHHATGPDDEPTETIRGTVRAIAAIRLQYTRRREPWTPKQIAENQARWEEAVAAAAGGDGLGEDGSGEGGFGWFAYSPLSAQPKPYTLVDEPVLGAVRTEPIDRAPFRGQDEDVPPTQTSDAMTDAEDESLDPVEHLTGYLVELEPIGAPAGTPTGAVSL